MNKSTISELIVALVFCALALALINPMHFWMPSMAHVTLLGVLAVLFAALLVFVLRERGGDERDETHRARAGRAAFLAGSGVLLVGIVMQSASGEPDPWLLAALIAMVLGKVVARAWGEMYR